MYLLHETIETKSTVLRNFTYDDIFIRYRRPGSRRADTRSSGLCGGRQRPGLGLEQLRSRFRGRSQGHSHQTEAEYTAPADDYREDLVRKGTGTGNYGFEVIVPWESYEDGSYLVEAYASGMKLSSPKVHSVGDMQRLL